MCMNNSAAQKMVMSVDEGQALDQHECVRQQLVALLHLAVDHKTDYALSPQNYSVFTP